MLLIQYFFGWCSAARQINHWELGREGEKHENGVSSGWYTSSGITLTQKIILSPTIYADLLFIKHGCIVFEKDNSGPQCKPQCDTLPPMAESCSYDDLFW